MKLRTAECGQALGLVNCYFNNIVVLKVKEKNPMTLFIEVNFLVQMLVPIGLSPSFR